jgi:prepilin-type processing-associated H-X9-DG protein
VDRNNMGFFYHTFGIAWAGTWSKNPGDPPKPYPYGMPNTYMFQVQPRPLNYSQCGAAGNCCNNWTTQTGHPTMNVAMGDGSVKAVSRSVSATSWSNAMMHNDQGAVGPDF